MPLMRGRAGFTLVELLIVLVMLGLVGAITVRVLTDTQRLTVAQGERAMVQTTTRTGVLVLPTELREINPGFGDITQMNDTSITYRGMRNLAISCTAPTTAAVRVATASIEGLKGFSVNDSILVFFEGNEPNSPNDDDWVLARVQGISTGTACDDGRPGTTLTFAGSPTMSDGSPVDNTAFGNNPMAVVRAFEKTTIAAYEDDNGDTWLGMLGPSDGTTIQPVLGPLAADSGLTLTYRDGSGAITTNPLLVQSIDVRVIGITTRPVHKGSSTPAIEYDSLTTRIALRNTF